MEYQVIKVYNNNVVLAKHEAREVVLVSKGIGFGKKAGDILEDNHGIEKVFHELSSEDTMPQLKEMHNDEEQLRYVIKGILKIAEDKLGPLKSNAEQHIKEHIEFAISRLKMGLTIENPFLDEIVALYKSEYKIAGIVRELIHKKMAIDIGDEEQGFIAMHLYAAKTQRSINETLRLTRLYQQCITIIQSKSTSSIDLNAAATKQFFNNLKMLLKFNKEGVNIQLRVKIYVEGYLPESYNAAEQIASYLKEHKKVAFSKDEIAYLTIEIEKLVQYANQTT